MYGDNMAVVRNSSQLESVLIKKSYSVCYHTIHESVAMGKALVGCIPSKWNITDLMTKVLIGYKRRYLVSNVLYDIHESALAKKECIQVSLFPLVIMSNLRGIERCIHT